MKVSAKWLQRYFEKPLPVVAALAEALTFHAFEIEEIKENTLDVKVLPDRAGYALSHRGIAKELSAILGIPIKVDPLREPIPERPQTNALSVAIGDLEKCLRYMGALVRGIKVGPSPDWLRELLESVGQQSINNVVDAMNFVMLDIGQPLHAFDAARLAQKGGAYAIRVEPTRVEEKITTLDGVNYTLPESTLLIADAYQKSALGIAGVKGGLAARITEATTDIIIESANFDSASVRRTAQALKLFTDASLRFQNRPSPELAAYGMRDALVLIHEVAGGNIEGVVDVYPKPPKKIHISVASANVSAVLGATYSDKDLADVFERLGLSYKIVKDKFIVTPPFERTDITIPEDLVEEVGRITGYDRVASVELPSVPEEPFSNHRKLIEAVRELMVAEGYNEISTYSLVENGDIELVMPLADDKKYLRTTLALGHEKAIALNSANLPLFGAPDLRMFEIGHVWPKGKEKFVLGVTYWVSGRNADKKIKEELTRMCESIKTLVGKKVKPIESKNTVEFDIHELGDTKTVPNLQMTQKKLSSYHSFSTYPFILRDIAVWVPPDTDRTLIYQGIRKETGELLLRCDLFDSFFKDGRMSYAFHLVFQSPDRTLSDAEINVIMNSVISALNAKEGWQVR